MIPKKIHYCWFGGNPLPESAKKCIESWKKFFPAFEIIEWNEKNFDVNCCDYVKEAYNAQKYAFVSDYARFVILYNEGGIYFDTDVEVIKSFEHILKYGGFMGIESLDEKNNVCVNPGLGLAIPPKHHLYKELMDGYKNRHFINDDGTYNLTTVVKYTSECLKKHGLINKSEIQDIEGIIIYPEEYFCPLSYDTGELKITPNTLSIHHYSATWLNDEDKYFHNLKRKYRKVLGVSLGSYFAKFIAIIKYEGLNGIIKKIRRRKK